MYDLVYDSWHGNWRSKNAVDDERRVTRGGLVALCALIAVAYLFYLGIQMWRSRGKMAIAEDRENQVAIKPYQLVAQGLVTAITNPKSWAFMISLLPAFINHHE